MEIYGRCQFIEAWPEWDYSVHEDDDQISRQSRAMSYPFTFRVDSLHKTARFSSTSILPYYDTSLSRCDCFDFQKRRLPCKHMYRLAVELGMLKIVKRSSGSSVSKELLAEVRSLENIDEHPEQIKRIEKAKGAKTTPAFIDFENQIASFKGSGKKTYETTVNTCTCRDYLVRRLPCKHIYRLRMELSKHNINTKKDTIVSNKDADVTTDK